ncbi:hypothetical protein [Arthrobacter rhombi]
MEPFGDDAFVDAQIFRDLADRGLYISIKYDADNVTAELFRVGAVA